MDERRKAQRKLMMFYTRVFDDITGEHLGYLGDLNQIGLMIIGQRAVELGLGYRLRLELPLGKYDRDHIVMDAKSVWGEMDIDPEFWDTGFQILKVFPDDLSLIEVLMKEYGVR